MNKTATVIDQLEALSAQLEALTPCPYSRSIFIGWLVQRLQALQGAGLTAKEVKAQLEASYLAWVDAA